MPAKIAQNLMSMSTVLVMVITVFLSLQSTSSLRVEGMRDSRGLRLRAQGRDYNSMVCESQVILAVAIFWNCWLLSLCVRGMKSVIPRDLKTKGHVLPVTSLRGVGDRLALGNGSVHGDVLDHFPIAEELKD